MQMQVYMLDTVNGTLNESSMRDVKKSRVVLTTLDEFEQNEMMHPCKKDILHGLKNERYCKVEYFRDSFQGIIRAPYLRQTLIFGFLLEKETLWIVSDSKEMKRLIACIEEDIHPGFSLHDFLLAMFNELIEHDMLYLQKIDDGLEKMEERILREKQQDDLNEVVLQYGRKISKWHAHYVQMMNIGDYMQSILREVAPAAESGWNLFTHRVERLHGFVEQIREHLVQVREMYQTQVDIQQNRVMTLLTIVTTIFMPLTLITGWYGMNFSFMPELEWKYGYLGIVILSITILIVEIWYFKKRKVIDNEAKEGNIQMIKNWK